MKDAVKKLDEAIAIIESYPRLLYYFSTPLKCLYSMKYDRKILAEYLERYPDITNIREGALFQCEED